MNKLYKYKILIILLIFLSIGSIYVFLKIQSELKKESNSFYQLPYFLHEISGITYIDDSQIAAIQDEDGFIYIYDLNKRTVIDTIKFENFGDYEGIAFDGENFYILRSDAILFKITNDKTIKYNLDIGAKNNEGLCFDKQNNRLLIATKSKVEKGKEYKDKRYIYAFDLNSNKLISEPLFVIDIIEIENFVNSANSKLEAKSGRKIIKFRPSGIAINPKDNNIYIVSAIDNIIIILNETGQVIDVKQLDISVFNKPEGITFLKNGEALIANEGGQGIPTLIKLNL